MTIQKLITEVCAPWVSNTALFLVLGFGLGAPGPGIVAAFLTGPGPMLVLLARIRRGRVGDHHVTQRSQRAGVFLMLLGFVAILAAVLGMMETPREMWVAVAAALGFLVLFALVTSAGVKISLHVGLWVTVWAYLGIVVSPWWALVLVLAPVVAWSRVKLRHHSLPEVAGGAAAGLLVLAVTIPAI